MSAILYDLCAADAARRFSPHCWKARMALAHKGIAFETRPVLFMRIKEIAGGFSPTVPILDDNGRLVRDSWDFFL
jgi:glutathione S-transferase